MGSTCETNPAANGRYTKALDNIKALRKERNIELKLDRERLGHFKADKEKAERVGLVCLSFAC